MLESAADTRPAATCYTTHRDLLLNPDTEATIARAKSASDASLLRRKGHLKEQVCVCVGGGGEQILRVGLPELQV